jgi:hypothetical protein
MKKAQWLLIVSLALLVPTFCMAAAFSELKGLPLEWKPTKLVSTYGAIDMTIYKNVRLVVTPFGDSRKRPSEIGQNIERRLADRDLLVTTKNSVTDWLTYNVTKVLSDFDIMVVKTNGNVTLEADVIKFLVTEKAIYQAEVAMKVKLKSAANQVIWEEIITGTATRFGGSYKAENYYEVLSDATISAIHNMLKKDSFVKAVQKATSDKK